MATTATARPKIHPADGCQTLYLSCDEYEVAMLGDTGPGKTWVLVVDALGLQFAHDRLGVRAIDVPTYRAILFRRKTTHLAKLIDESSKIYPGLGGRFLLQRTGDPGPSWTFPSGARIFLCHMEDEKNKMDHDGQEYQFIGFDEIQQFTITQYLYLHSRLRTTVAGLFTRVRATGMPTGSGWWWVRKRFRLDEEGVTRFYAAADDPVENPRGLEVAADHKDGRSRVFILGLLDQNPYVDKNDYKANVKQLGKRFEKAMLQHDWDAFAGDFWKEFEPEEVISPHEIPDHWPIVVGVDPGWGGTCAAAMWTRDPSRKVYGVSVYYQPQQNNDQNALGVKKWIESVKEIGGRWPDTFVAGHDAWSRRDRFAVNSTESTFADAFAAQGIILARAQIDRTQGWATMRNLMPDRLFIFRGYCQPLIDEMATCEADEKYPYDLKGRGKDKSIVAHALDSSRYALMAIYTPAEPAKEEEQYADGDDYMRRAIMDRIGADSDRRRGPV